MAPIRKFLYALPILVQAVCIIAIEVHLIRAFPDAPQPEDLISMPSATLLPILLLFALAVVATLAGLILYAVHVFSDNEFPAEKRTTWLVVLFLTGSVGQVIFWFRFIRRR